MSKWAERAKAALQKGDRSFLEKQLAGTRQQAIGSLNDLRFALESSGALLGAGGDLTLERLDELEKAYRAVAKKVSTKPDLKMIERLLGLTLGQSIVSLKGGDWAIYSGKYATSCPIVVRLPSGKYVDVFRFADDLNSKRSLDGASVGSALSRFVTDIEQRAFP